MVENISEMPASSNDNLDVRQDSLETPTSLDVGSKTWNNYDGPFDIDKAEPVRDVHNDSNHKSWTDYDKPFYTTTLDNADVRSSENKEIGDDNGKPYIRDGELIPNNQYELNGYHYTTDGQGRIIKVEGSIHIPENKEPRKNLPDINDAKETDDKGHLIAHEFGGADSVGNLVPMDAELNRHGEYRKCEREICQARREGKEVTVRVECDYENDSRPVSFTVTIEINGEVSERTILNK